MVLIAAVVAMASLVLSPSQPAGASGSPLFTSLTAGALHSCGLTSGGAAYCWGANSDGQLGNGTTTSSTTPVAVTGSYTFTSLSAGNYFTCGITTAQAMYCWGYGDDGGLGNGVYAGSTVPVLVGGSHLWSSVDGGGSHTCGVTTTGALYCWGWNYYGQLGDGTTTDRSLPTLVNGFTWTAVASGTYDTCGIRNNGAAYCWGWNNYGEVGDGSSSQRLSPTAVSGALTFSSITMGRMHVCALTSAGVAYCWGSQADGDLGDNSGTGQDHPVAVVGGWTWTSLAAGALFTCGIRSTGAAYCWGTNDHGNLGDGTTTDRAVPTLVAGGSTWTSLAAGGQGPSYDRHACGMSTAGAAYCWGSNGSGQLGIGSTVEQHAPISLLSVTVSTTVSVAVDPSFGFSVSGLASPCNGEAGFSGSAGSATSVALGHLAPSSSASGGQTLTVTSNAGGGFSVYIRGVQAANNLRSAGHNWADVAGTYAAPAAPGSGERFGYTYKDATASTSVVNPASGTLTALTSSTTDKVMGSATTMSGTGCVSYFAQTAAATPAGSYRATIIYTAVPSY